MAVLIAMTASAQTVKPDFSGEWKYDPEVTAADAKSANMIAGPIFGDEFVAEQTASSLTFKIATDSLHVTAVYALDGSPSTNLSPGDTPVSPGIEVKSNAWWENGRLVITSTSQSPGKAGPVVESIRTMWLDANGRLVIQRTGTPVSIVPSSRSVYAKQ
jgi:hypothetical protein